MSTASNLHRESTEDEFSARINADSRSVNASVAPNGTQILEESFENLEFVDENSLNRNVVAPQNVGDPPIGDSHTVVYVVTV